MVKNAIFGTIFLKNVDLLKKEHYFLDSSIVAKRLLFD